MRAVGNCAVLVLSGREEQVAEPKRRADEEGDHQEDGDHRRQPLSASKYTEQRIDILHQEDEGRHAQRDAEQ